jgi:hypothetical protein
MQKLVELFSRRASVDKPATEQPPRKRAASASQSVIDTNRAQNIAIGLRAFKDLNAKQIAEAISALRVATFTLEQITRLEEMFPTRQEITLVQKHVEKWAKQAKGEGTGTAPPAQTPSRAPLL